MVYDSNRISDQIDRRFEREEDREIREKEREEDQKIRDAENKAMRRHNYINTVISLIGSGIISLIVAFIVSYFSK